ncbi:MAG: hypothetical protein QUS07_07245 [Methanothrix sp.]|nr:hypothetical protein [Methanothrix sp.]
MGLDIPVLVNILDELLGIPLQLLLKVFQTGLETNRKPIMIFSPNQNSIPNSTKSGFERLYGRDIPNGFTNSLGCITLLILLGHPRRFFDTMAPQGRSF